MATKAKAAKGTKLKIGDGATPEVFTLIGEVKSFTLPARKTGTIDVTSFDSTDREFISDGYADGGEIGFEVQFIASDPGQVALDNAVGTTKNFQLILPDHATLPTTYNFAAVATQTFEVKGSTGDALTGSCSVKPTGARTVTRAP